MKVVVIGGTHLTFGVCGPSVANAPEPQTPHPSPIFHYLIPNSVFFLITELDKSKAGHESDFFYRQYFHIFTKNLLLQALNLF